MGKSKKIYIVSNTRDEFRNLSPQSPKQYNDHPSRTSILFAVEQIRKLGYDAEYFGGVNELIHAYESKQLFPDSLFLNFSDGLEQPNRKAQSAILLELLEVPFAGSDACSRLIAGNKQFAKEILKDAGISCPLGVLVHKEEDLISADTLHFPLIIKPNREGSSIGITQKILSPLERP